MRLAEDEARARLASLQLELAAREAALNSVKSEQTDQQQRLAKRESDMRRLRTADTLALRRSAARRASRGEASE